MMFMTMLVRISTHHVGPKKKLMVISAGKQMFLVGSTDQNLNLISELDNPASYLKDGEAILFGDNFDQNIQKENKEEKEFSIKKNIQESTPVNLKDRTTLSITDKLKQKINGAKDFQ